MRTRLGMLVAIVVFAAALPLHAQQPFMIPSNGNTSNVPSANVSPGSASIFRTTMLNKQDTSWSTFKPGLLSNFSLMQMLPTPNYRNTMQTSASAGPTASQGFTFNPNPNRPRPTAAGSSWRWPWSK